MTQENLKPFIDRSPRIAIVAARFNKEISERLLEGALEALKENGVGRENIAITWVPGAFEIPLIAQKYARSGAYDAIICMGAIIRGQTAHFDYVASQTAAGIMKVSLETDIPVLFAVLTTYNRAQAEARAGKREKNIGFKYALSALEMIDLLHKCV